MKKLLAAGVVALVVAIGAAVVADDDRPDPIKMLRADVKLLKADVAQLKARVAKLEAPPAGQPAVKPKPAQQRRLALKDVAALAPVEIRKLVGARVMGPVSILSVAPDPKAKGKYTVTATEITSSKTAAGAYARWVRNRWVSVRCVLTVSEAVALGLKTGAELKVVGDVAATETIPGDKNTVERIRLYLVNGQAR